jgi:hypothetical protein
VAPSSAFIADDGAVRVLRTFIIVVLQHSRRRRPPSSSSGLRRRCWRGTLEVVSAREAREGPRTSSSRVTHAVASKSSRISLSALLSLFQPQ